MNDLFSPLACASCGHSFPENVIPNSCPECGSTAYKNEKSSLSVRLSMSNSYSLSHITSAALHTRNSGALEDEYAGDICGISYLSDNEAFVTAAIFHAVAFLETTINEEFYDMPPSNFEIIELSLPFSALF